MPLAEYRVLDFGTAWAGPMVGQLLADFGAEVIKVETRLKLDGLRLGRPITGDLVKQGDEGKLPDSQASFHGVNRNKLSVTINAKHPKGCDILKRLVKISHVVIDNSSPGVMARLGLDHRSLEIINPQIVTISLTGAGESGPLKDAVTYALATTALGGLSSLIGYRHEKVLGVSSVPFGDVNASIHGVFAVLAALFHARQTGEGQHIELSESEAVTSLLGEACADYFMNGRVAAPQGNYDPVFYARNNYRCKGIDSWVSIAVKTDDEWNSLCAVIPRLKEDKRFEDKTVRTQRTSEIDAVITAWTLNHSPYEVTEILQDVGVAAFPVLNIEGQFLERHYSERQIYAEIQHPLVGTETIFGIPWKLSRTPGDIRRPAPSLGEHNQYVLTKILGVSAEEIQKLTDEKVVY